MLYQTKVQTSKCYIRECTSVLPYGLLLFGGEVTVQHAQSTLSVDGGLFWSTLVALRQIKSRK